MRPYLSLREDVSESLMLQSPKRVTALLEELRRSGVRMILDDFGTGYSSLSHLHRLPLDGLKLDRSFAQALMGDCRSRAIAQAIVQMSVDLGHTLNLGVVAEGIETPQQRQLLTDLGLPLLQGYLFGPPRPDWQPD